MSTAEADAIPRRKRRREKTAILQMVNEETGAHHQQEVTVVASDEQMEASAIIDKLALSFHRTLEFYKRCGYTPEQAQSYHDGDNSPEGRELARNRPAREISWYDISVLANGDIREALEVWGRVREAALFDWQAGMRSCDAVGAHTPMERARFLVIRDGFLDGWRPQNDMERAMIEMLAETFDLFQYWTAIAHTRATEKHDQQKKDVSRYEHNGWKSPYQSEADAIEQAHNLAKSYHRQFLNTLRHLRDFRRYSVSPPVIVNQGGQVNVGNQQVNVTRTD
jgi:hypothetical protein